MMMLFDKLDIPDFEGLDTNEAWEACWKWQEWAYDNAESFSNDEWDRVVKAMHANYNRYYEEYE